MIVFETFEDFFVFSARTWVDGEALNQDGHGLVHGGGDNLALQRLSVHDLQRAPSNAGSGNGGHLETRTSERSLHF